MQNLRDHLLEGQAIPALPLALDHNRKFSERHQRAVIRYYLASGVGGIAVGVHSTQFEIREPKHALFRPVLELAAREIDRVLEKNPRGFVKIAGICGATPQAVTEAEVAGSFGYQAGLLSLAALNKAPEAELVEHCRRVAEVIPVIGFYLQPAVGGRVLSVDFWRHFAEIPNVVAIKMAPFNRYQTLDVIRAVVEAGRDDIALYTGNDDTIVTDLLTPFSLARKKGQPPRWIVGGLLGHWGVWTKRAVELLGRIKQARTRESIPLSWLETAATVTDMNAAVFDAANHFEGCIPGILEVLRRQGLMPSNLCLNPAETLSKGQAEELDRVIKAYPDLVDDDFVRENLPHWLE